MQVDVRELSEHVKQLVYHLDRLEKAITAVHDRVAVLEKKKKRSKEFCELKSKQMKEYHRKMKESFPETPPNTPKKKPQLDHRSPKFVDYYF
jgi:septation ring formation regulator EzrA